MTTVAIAAVLTTGHARLDNFIAGKIDIMSEIDEDGKLLLFYQRLALLPQLFEKSETRTSIDLAVEGAEIGQSYVVEHNLMERFANNRTLRLYKDLAEKRGVSWGVDPLKTD